MTTTQKTCFKCGETKNLSEFYRHKGMKDGHLNKCKECTKSDAAAHRSGNLDKVRAYDRMRYRRDEYRQLQVMEWAKSLPEYRRRAVNALSNALRDGKIDKPEGCWHCGSTERVEAHHASYDIGMELAVTWLCKPCHCKAHAQTPNRETP